MSKPLPVVPLLDTPPGFYAVSGLRDDADMQAFAEETLGVFVTQNGVMTIESLGRNALIMCSSWILREPDRFAGLATHARQAGLTVFAPGVEVWMDKHPELLPLVNGLVMTPGSEESLRDEQLALLSKILGGTVSKRGGRTVLLHKDDSGKLIRQPVGMAIF